ncbi:MAG: YdjY domain-containing protein [Planctomycetales bacterium]
MTDHLCLRRDLWRGVALWGLLIVSGWGLSAPCRAVDDEQSTSEAAKKPLAELTPFNRQGTVLVDKAGKRVVLKARVVLLEGSLEQLCCLKQTKEHESILSLDAQAKTVHAALLVVGAKPGTPVQNNPEYRPPTGQTIDVFLNWTDAEGKAQRAPAQSWVRHATRRFWAEKLAELPAGVKLPKNTELRYDQKLRELSWYGPMTARERDAFLALSSAPAFQEAIRKFFEKSQSRKMEADWVFAGSGFFTDEETGKSHYLAEDGDLICVANFASATLDVAIPSSSEGEVLFEAWTERIPPRETPVTIELIPHVDEEEVKAP